MITDNLQLNVDGDPTPDYPYNACKNNTVELSVPPGLIPQYGDLDATGRPAFLVGPYGSATFNPENAEAETTAYYAATNPAPSLGQWWVDHGFGVDGLLPAEPENHVRIAYQNHNDLGFGRDMHCAKTGENLACYVTNYGAPDETNQGNADLAQFADRENSGATVVMSYAAAEPDETQRVQFAVYDGGTYLATLLRYADLDGMGPKPVPHLCTVCHGGRFQSSEFGGNDKVTHARFREFDLATFKYPGARSWDYSPQSDYLLPGEKAGFALLNKHVRDITAYTVSAEYPAGDRLPIRSLIDSWYPNGFDGSPNPVRFTNPPNDWDTADDNDYHEIYGKSCRTCHIARDSGKPDNQLVFSKRSELADTSFVVCGSDPPRVRVMPNSIVTYKNFWADTARVIRYENLTGQTQGTCND